MTMNRMPKLAEPMMGSIMPKVTPGMGLPWQTLRRLDRRSDSGQAERFDQMAQLKQRAFPVGAG